MSYRDEDISFIKSQISAVKEFKILENKNSFNLDKRMKFTKSRKETENLVESLKQQFKEKYA